MRFHTANATTGQQEEKCVQTQTFQILPRLEQTKNKPASFRLHDESILLYSYFSAGLDKYVKDRHLCSSLCGSEHTICEGSAEIFLLNLHHVAKQVTHM